MRPFVNLSNHPSIQWPEDQLLAARNLGDVIDLPFPDVNPSWTLHEVSQIADGLVESLAVQFLDQEAPIVLVQGEMTLLYQILVRLKKKQWRALAATTQRDVHRLDNGTEIRRFVFCGFRDYYDINDQE